MILGHCHLFPGGLAEKRDAFGVPGTSEHLERFMRACGFDQAQVLAPFDEPIATDARSRIAAGGLAWLLEQPHVGTSPDAALIPTAAINPALPQAVDQLREARRRGVRLLKLHPLIVGFDVFDPACRPFLAEAEAARMPVTYHTGTAEGWGQSSACVSPAACARLAGLYPGLPILMAHCGTFGGASEAFESAVDACRDHGNLHLDATGALQSVGLDRWRRAAGLLGPERISYGRDYPWTNVQMVDDDVAFIEQLGLGKEGTRWILGETLRRLWSAVVGV